jgi:2-keto-4-pentenoate hydratase/2-oxohepta-3-ene-1,7-dioic acid hydratase in catechol pathway
VHLLSYRDGTTERLGLAVGERVLPATSLLPGGPATMGELLAGGEASLAALRAADAAGAERIRHEGTPIAGLHLLAPVPRPGKVVAIGLNYHAHAAEQNVEPPKAPLIFAKFPTAVIGPGEAIAWDPALTAQVDYEAELAVVIGRRARNVPVEEEIGRAHV